MSPSSIGGGTEAELRAELADKKEQLREAWRREHARDAEIARLRAVEKAARNLLENYDDAFSRNRGVVTPLSFLGIVTLRAPLTEEP